MSDLLSPRGAQEIATLAEKIKSATNGLSVLILTSTAPRASQSAIIIKTILGAEVKESPALWSDNEHPKDLQKALALIKAEKDHVDVLIIVTHYEYTERLPGYFAKEVLGVPLCSELNLVEKGQAWVIDCIKKTMTRLT
jgi:phosphohistidine phosphatase SixA